MTKRSLKASPRGAQIAKDVFERKGLTQDQLAEDVGLSSRQSVWKFFTGRPIERYLFKEICFRLDLEWEEIADLPQSELIDSPNIPELNNQGIEGWSNQMRCNLAEQLQNQCNTLQSPLTFTQPLLDQIYILTTILVQPSNQRWLDVSDFRVAQSNLERTSLTQLTQEAVSGMKIIENHDKLMILGKPGAGKTTFLHYITLQCINGKYRPDLVPCLLQLRSIFPQPEEEEFSLHEIILNLGQRCNLTQEQTQALIDEGKFLLLLDGLDEIPEDETEIIFKEVTNWVNNYHKNPVIITSRSGFQKYYFQGFTYVELADFNPTQIEDYVQKWFVATDHNKVEGQQKAEQFLEQLEKPNNEPIKELCVTPILLSLLCSVFKEKATFPTKRAKLYQAGLDILLQRWDQARGIHRDQIYRHLDLTDKLRLLYQIAALTFEKGNYFFESSEVLPIIEDYLKTLPNASTDLETLWLNSEAVLKAIEFQHGVLIERAKDVYSFSHLTFHEYLTARKIVVTPTQESLNTELEKLATHLTDFRWREVMLLTASMLPKADFLLEKMRAEIEAMVKQNQALKEFLTLIQEKVNSLQLSYRSSSLRAFYFTLVQNRDFNLAIALDESFASLKNIAEPLNLDLALARALTDSIHLVHEPDLKKFLNLCFSLDIEGNFSLELPFKQALEQLKSELPDPEENKIMIQNWWQTHGKNWVEQFRQLLLNYRLIGYDLQLSPEQKELWHQYYRANEFLVECLKSDCQVNPKIRHNIEESLLLPI